MPKPAVTCLTLTLALIGAALGGCSTAPKAEDQPEFLSKAQWSAKWFERSVNGLPRQIDKSAGFVVFPDVAQWGILISGGKYGRGVVCKADGEQIGWAAINTSSVGLEAGIEGFKVLMVFQDEATLDRFKHRELTGSVSGVLVAAESGTSATDKFEHGVAVYEGANRGLMAGVNIGLNYIRFEPLGKAESPGDIR